MNIQKNIYRSIKPLLIVYILLINHITFSNLYAEDNLEKIIRNVILGEEQLDLEIHDINKDGIVNVADVVRI